MRLWPRRRVYVDDLPRTHDVRFASLFMLALVLLVAGLYFLGHVVAGDRLPRGTTVAGIDVGGMKRGEAATTLQAQLAPRLQHRITATVLTHTFSIDPQRAGMTFDIDATIDSALGGDSWDPRHMLHVLSGGDDLQPIIDVNANEVDATLDRVAATVERPAVDAAVSFDSGRPEIVYAREGTALGYSESRRRLEGALLSGRDRIRFPLTAVDPDVTSTEAADFVSAVAQPAVSSPVSIGVADRTVTLQPRAFVPALRAVPAGSGSELTLSVDADQLYARSQGRLDALPNHPVSARVVFRAGRPSVVPGRSGVSVEPSDWAAAVLSAAERSGASRRAEATVHPDPPAFTTSDARMLRLRQPVATATVGSARPSDVPAVARASAQLDGTLLAAGESFSFLHNVDSGDVGAASVVASAAYRAALVAGMSDLERTPHSFYSPAFADGMDALVESPSVDLQWRDATPYGVYVRSWVSPVAGGGASVHVQLWSSPYWQVSVRTSNRFHVMPPRVRQVTTPGCTPRNGVGGFDVDVTRTSTRPGKPRVVEKVHTSYRPLDTVVCRRPASTTGP